MALRERFGDYNAYTLDNGVLCLRVTDLGATVLSLRFQGRELVLGYDRAEDYLRGTAYLGAVIGRCANRIAGAAFSLNGRTFRLEANEGRNQLHGGPEAFDKRRWSVEEAGETLRFFLCSPDGDKGYPGELHARVGYRLEGACLRLDFEAECDRDTVYAPTSHQYFDLAGRGRVLDARLQLNAEYYAETGEEQLPTGRLLPTEGRFDFRRLRVLDEDYDQGFLLCGGDCCVLEDGGLRMTVKTSFPAVQLYTGRWLPPPHGANAGLAIEPGFLPDSPNQAGFPSVLLRAGERFHHYIEYHFSTVE